MPLQVHSISGAKVAETSVKTENNKQELFSQPLDHHILGNPVPDYIYINMLKVNLGGHISSTP